MCCFEGGPSDAVDTKIPAVVYALGVNISPRYCSPIVCYFCTADDEADLEEVLRSGLVPWVRQKLGGQAPNDVCLWLLRVIMGHESSAVVLAAEEALVELLGESRRVSKLFDGRSSRVLTRRP